MFRFNGYRPQDNVRRAGKRLNKRRNADLDSFVRGYVPLVVDWDEETYRTYTNGDGSLNPLGVMRYAVEYDRRKTPIPPGVLPYGTWYDENGQVIPNAEPSDQEDDQTENQALRNSDQPAARPRVPALVPKPVEDSKWLTTPELRDISDIVMPIAQARLEELRRQREQREAA